MSTITASAPETLVAWQVTIDDMSCICFAATAPKARWLAVKAYREAGYGCPGVWPRATAGRRPIYDNHAAKTIDPKRAYSEAYL